MGKIDDVACAHCRLDIREIKNPDGTTSSGWCCFQCDIPFNVSPQEPKQVFTSAQEARIQQMIDIDAVKNMKA